jgi:hypothetical protein
MNKYAQALGRLARGKKKTMSPEAIEQRRRAGMRPKRKKNYEREIKTNNTKD